MKFKVIQGEKGQGEKGQDEKGTKQETQNQKQNPSQKNSEKPVMEDYYAKERPRSQEMEQAEGDEDIVDDALKNQEKAGNAA